MKKTRISTQIVWILIQLALTGGLLYCAYDACKLWYVPTIGAIVFGVTIIITAYRKFKKLQTLRNY